MKKIFFLISSCILIISQTVAQSVPVTFYYTPTYTNFSALRLVGTMNNWNNADNNMLMTDPDGDGEYTITVDLAKGVEYNYKFVMDANWGLAYSDPNNPRINAQDNNNSIITVSDPMLVYLLPRGVTTTGNKFVDTTQDGLPIRAILAYTEGLNIYVFQVGIDGEQIQNPLQYFNQTTKEFYYQPPVQLSEGDHTVSFTMVTNRSTIQSSATFSRIPGHMIPKSPYDFYFDRNNSRSGFTGNVNAASAVGAFNNWNELFNPMQDDDADGLWETTVLLEEGSYEYKFKLNGSYWLNDPDEPRFGTSADNNNLVIVNADSVPTIKLLSPNDQSVFNSDTTITLTASLRPGGTSDGVDANSIKVWLDETEQIINFDSTNNICQSAVNLNGEGLHTIKIQFTNKEGLSTEEVYSYGIHSRSTGLLFVDAINDRHYDNPAGMSQTGNDIQYVRIDETAGHDSLQFTIALDEIHDRTRIGLIITNPSNSLIDAPFNLGIKVSNWADGIFAALGKPGNQYENTDLENKFLVNPSNLSATNENISPDSDEIENGIFSFRIATTFLDSLLGSWIDTRQVYIFSYIANEDKSGNAIEITTAEGGSAAIEDPNIYDAAFIRSGFWQKRMFNSFIPAGQKNGPRVVALDGSGRGITTIKSSDISDSLETHGIVIKFLTPSVTYWKPTITVAGTLSDPAIPAITFIQNGVQSSKPVINSEFSVSVTLTEGENSFIVKAQEADGFITTSRELIINYQPDKMPVVSIGGSVSGRNVNLNAQVSYPSGSLSYVWEEEPNNPQSIGISSSANSVSFTIPQTEGEYLVKLTVEDSEGNSSYAKKMIFAKDDSVWLAGINDHASWIDSAVFYEIYPRSFTQQGGFNGVTSRIPQMLDLGINAVWLMPIYDGPTTHGYEITDYYGFEGDYGTEQDFINMVDALHAAGIKVILDYVVNHTSIQHPFMQNVFEYGEYSPWADFYLWQGEPGNSNYEYYYDWGSLPNLNHDNPDVRKYFIDVAKHWVSNYDIDGFRCDVAWGVEERNQDYWMEWRAALKNIKPGVFLQAEASSADAVFYNQRFDSANDWDLRSRIIETISATNSIAVLDAELRRPYPSHARPFRFVENHDENRIAATFDGARSKLAHTIFFMANGVPLIYAGGEVGEQTYRDLIDWDDPENLYPYFRRMIQIRKEYIYNPVISGITNSDPLNVYSFSSTSGSKIIITAANMRNTTKSITIDLNNLPFSESESTYLTNLFTGDKTEVTSLNRSSVELDLEAFEAGVFYYGDSVTVVSNESTEDNLVTDYELHQNYPNPFNPSTKISYQIPHTGKTILKVYNILGQEVRMLVNEVQSAGKYEIRFDASELSSGIYIYRLTAIDNNGQVFEKSAKMMMLK